MGSESREVEKTESRTFNAGFLQLFLVVTRTVHINGVFSKTITRDWLDSVSVENDMSYFELKQLAKEVVAEEYGHYRTGQIQGSTFTEESCVNKKKAYQVQRVREGCYSGSTYGV